MVSLKVTCDFLIIKFHICFSSVFILKLSEAVIPLFICSMTSSSTWVTLCFSGFFLMSLTAAPLVFLLYSHSLDISILHVYVIVLFLYFFGDFIHPNSSSCFPMKTSIPLCPCDPSIFILSISSLISPPFRPGNLTRTHYFLNHRSEKHYFELILFLC